MVKVTVYKIQLYDAVNDSSKISRRMATTKGAERMGGEILADTAIEIEASQLETGEEWTVRDFNPNATVGFQKQVMP